MQRGETKPILATCQVTHIQHVIQFLLWASPHWPPNFQPSAIIALFPTANTHINRNFPTDPRVPSIPGHLVTKRQHLSRTPHGRGSGFPFPRKIKKLLLSFEIQPVLCCVHPNDQLLSSNSTDFDFPSPHLFKDWNENIISKCTICFSLSSIWPVSSSLRYPVFRIHSGFTTYFHTIPLF